MGVIVLSGNASNSIIGWLAFAVATVTLLGLAFLILMYLLSSGPLGTLNDICNGLGALLSLVLAVALFAQQHARNPWLAVLTMILAVVGAAIAVQGSRLIITGSTGFFLAGMYTMTGYALIGLWLVAANYRSPWPQGIVTFGLIAGIVMALGCAAIPSIFLRIDSFEAATWHTWLGQVGFIGWAILYPIWCLRLWSVLRAG